MHLAFPFSVDNAGFPAEATTAEHVEQMIEQILFTRPGERVNLPEFGCGVQALIFGPMSVELATALRARVEASIQRWMPAIVQLGSTEIAQDGSTLTLTIIYTLTATGERRARVFRL
jgi:uncharacterized protein